ncbi:MAG TPA: GNAT family N-acetyltransferase [Vicinamibacterales bacterium]|nr:GNAT family N-acetyltransferase [Vicinamibacterales bacterium]
MSLSVVPAVGPVLERVLDDTFPLWNDGLNRERYGKYWSAQLGTAWGTAHLDRVALQDGPHVVSSTKRYDLAFRIDGRHRRVLGMGAVFTAPAYRGRGAAKELLSRVIETAEAEGYEFAALFSEVDPSFFERLDFVPVPLAERRVEVDRKGGGPPAILVRSGEDRDIPAIADISGVRGRDARLAIERSEDFIRYSIARRRLLAGLGPPGVREVEFLVSEEGHQPAAYLVCVSHRGEWMIEDAGDRDPSGARVGAMLQVMLARHPGETVPHIRAWLPASLAPPQVRIAATTPTQEVLMIRPLKDRTLPLPPLSADEVVFWHGDHF